MASFFEKLKKGMGVEVPEGNFTEDDEEKIKESDLGAGESEEKSQEEVPLSKKTKRKRKVKEEGSIEVKEPEEADKEEFQEEIKTEENLIQKKHPKKEKGGWFEPEGQLAIDVYETNGNIVIQSAIAGVKPEDLDISIENDVVIIKGRREKPSKEMGNYFCEECFWGPFSRKIIMPNEVDPSRAQASMKEGVLTIRIPKIEREKKRTIAVR